MSESEILKETERLSRLAEEGAAAFARREEEVSRKRLGWWEENRERLGPIVEHLPILDRAYRIFYLEYLGLDAEEVPVVECSEDRLVIRSYNFCPVHHACARIGLDTRNVCQAVYEGPVNDLLKQIHSNLRFGRNYDAIRPHAPYCEEYIELVD